MSRRSRLAVAAQVAAAALLALLMTVEDGQHWRDYSGLTTLFTIGLVCAPLPAFAVLEVRDGRWLATAGMVLLSLALVAVLLVAARSVGYGYIGINAFAEMYRAALVFLAVPGVLLSAFLLARRARRSRPARTA